MDLMFVYLLEHVYEKDEIEEIKSIGIFSKHENAEKAIEHLKNQLGFKEHSIDCFHIHKIKLDEYEWKEGFISWEEANEE